MALEKAIAAKAAVAVEAAVEEKRQHLVPCALPQIPGYRCWASRVVSQARDSSFISELNSLPTVHASLYMELLCLLVSSLQGATMVLTLRISRCFDLDHLESWLRLVFGHVSSAVSSGGEVWKQRSLFKNLEVQGLIRVRTLGFMAHNSGLSVLGLVPLRQHDFRGGHVLDLQVLMENSGAFSCVCFLRLEVAVPQWRLCTPLESQVQAVMRGPDLENLNCRRGT